MAKYTLVTCTHPGCTRDGRFEYSNAADLRSIHTNQGSRWKCYDHYDLERRLSPEQPQRTYRMTARPSFRNPEAADRYWYSEGSDMGSGLAYGPGFTARTEDFPPGTILEVTARIILPEEPR